MNPITFHVLLPAILPALFFLAASTPVEVLGCFTRGLIALLIALGSVTFGLGAGAIALKQKKIGGPKANWWALTALILALPPAALLILA